MAKFQPQTRRRPADPKEGNMQRHERPPKQSEVAAIKSAAVGEEDFPRGGADTLTALERRELTAAAIKEVEQELADGKLPKAKRARITKSLQADAEDAFFSKHVAALEGNMATHVDLLRVKDLRAGTRVWGMVLGVTSRGLEISLPHGLRGSVAANQASDVLTLMLKAKAASEKDSGDRVAARPNKGAAILEAVGGAVPALTDLFAVGQFVRCVVAEAPPPPPPPPPSADNAERGKARRNKHVALSLLLRDVQGGMGSEALMEGLVLGAVVRSVEDHGYTLSFGIKGTSGFLRKRDYEEQFGEGLTLQVGGLLDVIVRNAADKRNVIVSCAPGDVAAAVTRESESLTGLEGLLPGALLNVKVRRVLRDGLLVSFLTFFHGTIGLYHLPALAEGTDWRKTYKEGAKLRARLLYVDPATKRTCLSLLPHLVALALPSPVPMLGSVFEDAEVMRIDGGMGMLLKLEGLPEGAAVGYCNVINALEERVPAEELVKEINARFKAGMKLRARVIGYRLLDGMANLTVRPGEVDAVVLSHADLVPGMFISGTVLSVPDRDGDGVLRVEVAKGIIGAVPKLHASEISGPAARTGPKAGRIKVKVGDSVDLRVLAVNPAARKLTLTLRKTLLKAKAAPLVSMDQAVPGARFYGVVTGLHDRLGVYVSFFADISGLAPHSQLGLEPGQVAKDAFAVGQIVKATILSVAYGRIKLSLAAKSKAAAAVAAVAEAPEGSGGDPLDGLQPGDIVDAVVLEVHTGASETTAADAAGGTAPTTPRSPFFVCHVQAAPGGAKVCAKLDEAHLSDHPAAVEALRAVVRPGTKLGRVVVLERLEHQSRVRVSRKPSLVAAAAAEVIPRTFEEVHEGAVLPGYVALIRPDAVYVRFLARLQGRAGLPQLSDVFVSDPAQIYTEGQSVRCQVATCDPDRQRFTLLLKPSVTASTDAAYLLGYFREMQQLQTIRAEAEGAVADGGGDVHDADADISNFFPLGGEVTARVHEVKEYGILCDIDDHPDVVGLVPSSHVGELGSSPALGSQLRGRVLDVVRHQGLVEISLKPDMLEAARGKAAAKNALKTLKHGDSVEAVVEGMRPGEYLILSLPQHASLLAYAAVTDYNTPRPDLVPRTFSIGQRVIATVAVLPSEAPGGRLLCHVPLTHVATSLIAGGAKVPLTPGSVVQTVVTGIQQDHLEVQIRDSKVSGRVHITELVDINDVTAAAVAAAAATVEAPPAAKKARKAEPTAAATGVNPLDSFRMQQEVEAVVLGRLYEQRDHGQRWRLDLSLRPSRLEAAKKGESQARAVKLTSLSPGMKLPCFVVEVAEDAVWLTAGPTLRGRVSIYEASTDPNVLAKLPTAFPIGTPVTARILAVDCKRKKLDLSLVDPEGSTTSGADTTDVVSRTGALVMGRIYAITGFGVRVKLGARGQVGCVALTDIHDHWVPNALKGLKAGTYVRVRVLGQKDEFAMLSLRPSQGGAVAGGRGRGSASAGKTSRGAVAPELLEESLLKVGNSVTGYVKNSGSRGLFITLDRFRDGLVRLSNVSDGEIKKLPAAFPRGMRLEARVIKVDGNGRVELSLRAPVRKLPSSSEPVIPSIKNLRPGQLVTGVVRSVRDYGVIVALDDKGFFVGLAHKTELAEQPMKDPSIAFTEHQVVRAVVIQVDAGKKRVSLSLKPSKIKSAQAAEEAAEKEARGKGAKRRRTADIDEEIAAAGGEEDDEEGGGEDQGQEGDGADGGDVDGEGEEEDDGDEADAAAAALDSDQDVDDVDVSEDVEEDGGEEAGGFDDDSEGTGVDDDDDDDDDDDEEEEEEEGRALQRFHPAGTASTVNLDLTAPWGEMLLADDPRVSGGAGATDDVAVDGSGAERKLSKGQKKRLKEQREQEIRAAELARLSGPAAPTTPADFERLVLASPNSSFVWIKYMAMHLNLGDVDSARKVAQRALDTINYREENEKFNVWVAWLNLENAYGITPSPEEAAMGMLKKALQYTDQKKMYMAALGIFERTGRDELAEQVERALTKKFGGSSKVWARAIERALQKNDGESARNLLERALQSLPRRKHIKALVRAALAEFRVGSAERGRGILEGVLRNYPKRLDLWNVYIDQELKTGEQQRIRALFERATHLPLPPKKMKFLFRRYLEYEKSEGDAAAVEHVKRLAMDFVEKSLKA
ncbi:hypothetical protein VaNZ11_013243 [Volvox africanus]|uniref:S1 motif domain-containing protein n=1 Tax=Volvox africanus TaxID=51714 RepID=A0ABQ5SHS1_9CHLO|nr:hypothetical protein VaNZ11_013243 [Volvox africanus]